MPTNAQKTITDAGYIAVGLGVMGFQQAQIRARAARDQVAKVGGCVAGRARDVRSTLDAQTQTARTEAETQVRNTRRPRHRARRRVARRGRKAGRARRRSGPGAARRSSRARRAGDGAGRRTRPRAHRQRRLTDLPGADHPLPRR